MILKVGNVETKAIIGGTDYLLDLDLMQTMREYLRVRPDDYRHSSAYKKRQWDGYRYFITPSGTFATGFLPLVAKYAVELGVTVKLEDERGEIPRLKDELDPYIGNIDGEEWYGRDYQMEALSTINYSFDMPDGSKVFFPRGILDCATNAGKNSMVALLVKNLETPCETVFMVSNKTIYEQAVEFFTQVFGKDYVGEVKSGKYDPKMFTVCMVKSLYNYSKKSINVKRWLKTVKVLVVDESDEAGAKEYSRVLTYIGASMRILVSGTPLESSTVHNMIAIGLSGKVLYKVTNKELIEKGHSQKPIVRIVLNNAKMVHFRSYTAEISDVVHRSIQRAALVCDVIAEHSGKQILVSFSEIEHGRIMYDVVCNKYPELAVGFVYGDSTDRKGQLAAFKSGETTVLFASMILKRGANIPNIQVLIAAQAGKSTITVKQLSGRALRHDGISDTVLIYDFYDVGKYTSAHSRQRIKIYHNEEFDVEYLYENKKGRPVLMPDTGISKPLGGKSRKDFLDSYAEGVKAFIEQVKPVDGSVYKDE